MKRTESVIMIATVLVFSVLEVSLSALVPGQMSAVRRESKAAKERIDGFHKLLYDEIKNPTKRHKGWGGGDINHDYQMAQIITSLINTVTPMTATGRSKPEKSTVEYIKQLLIKEKLPEAIDTWQIVLANCKVTTVMDDLITLANTTGRSHVRNRAVHGLRRIDDIVVIPDYLFLLDDEAGHLIHEKFGTELMYDYPVRRAAFIALKLLGVEIYRDEDLGGTKKYEYQVHTNSAIQILVKDILTVSDNRSKKLLISISRVGGEHAKKSLQTFVINNDNQPEKTELVLEAKKLLLKFEPVKVDTVE